VNWAQANEFDSVPSIEHKTTFFSGASGDHDIYLKAAGQWNEGRNLIIPSYLKDITGNRLLLNVWNQAFDALTKATEVVAIGFQLHPADAQARQLLATSLLRNQRLAQVSLIAPPDGPDYWNSFCVTLGKRRKPIRKYFEEWILEL
jgi:hypothetical protein